MLDYNLNGLFISVSEQFNYWQLKYRKGRTMESLINSIRVHVYENYNEHADYLAINAWYDDFITAVEGFLPDRRFKVNVPYDAVGDIYK